MAFEFVGVLLFAVITAVVLASVPLLLTKCGFFGWLGRTKAGVWLANKLGSSEPSKFALNITRVFFFVLIAFYVVTGIAGDATQYEIHKAAIAQMETCNNTFTAVQVAWGSWAIKCEKAVNLTSFIASNASLNLSV